MDECVADDWVVDPSTKPRANEQLDHVPKLTRGGLRYALQVSVLALLAALAVGGAIALGGVAFASQLSTDPCSGQDWCFGISAGFVAISALAICSAAYAAVRTFSMVKER